jgi:glucose uptake protein
LSLAAPIWSLTTVLAWGTWLAPLELAGKSDERFKTLFITLGNLGVAAVVAGVMGFSGLGWSQFWPSMLGGLVWAWSGIAAVIAIQRLGMAKAMGIWSPLNIIVSMLWGMALFGEFLSMRSGKVIIVLACVAAMVAGILLIVFATDQTDAGSGDEETEAKMKRTARGALVGVVAALVAGVGWGSYFIPIRVAETSSWVAAFPLAVGMAIGAAMPLALRPSSARPGVKPGTLAMVSGLMWAVGNYGSLQMMELLGTGRGFTIAQSCVVVNALVGVFVFKRPRPNSLAGFQTLLGVAIATVGAVGLGLLK